MSRARSGGLAASFDARATLAAYRGTGRKCGRAANTEESFWANVDASGGPDACWPWKLRRGDCGHGFVSWAGKDCQAHRVAWSLTHGPIEAGVVIRHRCDNPPCCNPAHLVPGTIADNNRDARERGQADASAIVAHGRASAGTANVNAKLDDDRVLGLRTAWAHGETLKSICQRTGLAMGTVHPMVHGRTWKHVPLVERLANNAIQVREGWDAIEGAVAAMGAEAGEEAS